MKRLGIIVVFMAFVAVLQPSYAQTDGPNMELVVSDEEKTVLFAGFAIAVIGIFLFLARDIILRKKTSYDKEELESKKDKTYEKYHSDWGDDYEDIGKSENKEFHDAASNGGLSDYYGILKVPRDATQEEIKSKFRELAKKAHPDKTGDGSGAEMAGINKAYETLSDRRRRASYDSHLKQLD